jgi:hypothetical protein
MAHPASMGEGTHDKDNLVNDEPDHNQFEQDRKPTDHGAQGASLSIRQLSFACRV